MATVTFKNGGITDQADVVNNRENDLYVIAQDGEDLSAVLIPTSEIDAVVRTLEELQTAVGNQENKILFAANFVINEEVELLDDATFYFLEDIVYTIEYPGKINRSAYTLSHVGNAHKTLFVWKPMQAGVIAFDSTASESVFFQDFVLRNEGDGTIYFDDTPFFKTDASVIATRTFFIAGQADNAGVNVSGPLSAFYNCNFAFNGPTLVDHSDILVVSNAVVQGCKLINEKDTDSTNVDFTFGLNCQISDLAISDITGTARMRIQTSSSISNLVVTPVSANPHIIITGVTEATFSDIECYALRVEASCSNTFITSCYTEDFLIQAGATNTSVTGCFCLTAFTDDGTDTRRSGNNSVIGNDYDGDVGEVANMSWSGPWGTGQAGVIKYVLRDGFVTLSSPDILDTATNATIITSLNNLPANISPATDKHGVVSIVNNGPTALGTLLIKSTGVIEIYENVNFGPFTGAGNTGFRGFQITYNVDL